MIIYCNIHGYIEIDPTAASIIDTPVFQRLRSIHQTGVLYLVYPTANHSRFEHSIGTYHLARKMISSIAAKQPELNITSEIILLVSLAGLCHDLGHLLFSHLFDDYFLPNLPNYQELSNKTTNVHHENRSIVLLNYIVKKYSIDLSAGQLRVIADLINPKTAEYSKWKPQYMVGKWIFQIISNPLNSIDVDKFDYLTRDTKAVGLKIGFDYSRIIDDARVISHNGGSKQNICYSTECNDSIYHMFFLRYRLHRQIYNNKTIKAVEILILKLLFEIEKTHNISNYILEPENMIKLIDSMIYHVDSPEITNILEQLTTRKLPQMIFQDISLNPIEFDINRLNQFNKSSYETIQFKVGYVGGKSNPLSRITFYDLNTGLVVSENKVRDFSLLINQKHQEYFYRVYCTDLSKVNQMITALANIEVCNKVESNVESIELKI
jgi:HD superfamily phosphohydrolase